MRPQLWSLTCHVARCYCCWRGMPCFFSFLLPFLSFSFLNSWQKFALTLCQRMSTWKLLILFSDSWNICHCNNKTVSLFLAFLFLNFFTIYWNCILLHYFLSYSVKCLGFWPFLLLGLEIWLTLGYIWAYNKFV